MVVVQYGCLFSLAALLVSPLAAKPVIAKLRSAGVDCFRYVLDNPLVQIQDLGLDTATNATRIAAQVRGAL